MFSFGQKSKSVVSINRKPTAMVTYTMSSKIPSLASSEGEVKVFFNNERSLCINAAQPLKSDVIGEIDGGGEIKVIEGDSEQSAVYVDNQAKHVVFKVHSPIANENVIHDTLPTIDWKIVNEFTVVGNQKCQKATCQFGGRSYMAWFSKDLPYNIGPYKFRGLPGMILSIASTDGVINYVFKRFEKSDKLAQIIKEPVNTTKFTSYSANDFKAKSAKRKLDDRKKMQARFPDAGFIDNEHEFEWFIEKDLEWWQ